MEFWCSVMGLKLSEVFFYLNCVKQFYYAVNKMRFINLSLWCYYDRKKITVNQKKTKSKIKLNYNFSEITCCPERR